MTPPLEQTTGVILAGGASSRFGSNKALALLDGKPLISHVADAMEKLFPDLLLVTNTPQTYAFLGWEMIGDIHRNCGPLAGIHSALHKTDNKQIFIAGCDMPLIDPTLIAYICTLPGEWDAALPCLERGPEPLYGIYRKSCLPVIEKQLLNKQGKIRLALEKIHLRKISQEEILAHLPDLRTFHNINRQSDLQMIQQEGRLRE